MSAPKALRWEYDGKVGVYDSERGQEYAEVVMADGGLSLCRQGLIALVYSHGPLISAAPDVLAAALLMVEGDGQPDETVRAMAALRAAIAKALPQQEPNARASAKPGTVEAQGSAGGLKVTVKRMAALVVLYRAPDGLSPEDFSECLWGKPNRFSVAFLRRLVNDGLAERVHFFGGSNVPYERYRLSAAGQQLFAEVGPALRGDER